MAFSESNIFDALRKVKHPESGSDIVSLGMVTDMHVSGKNVSFSLVFNRSNHPLSGSVKKACERAIHMAVDPKAEIKINISSVSSPEQHNEPEVLPGVKNIIAVASGKGGVGKSTVAANLAIALALKGAKVGLLDADIFGPSAPKMFGLENVHPEINQKKEEPQIMPLEKFGIKILSMGFFVGINDAVVWRGPMASSALKQMISQGAWGELDYLLIDLPPGTSDIHLTLVQTLAITGAIIVSTPQEVALADVIKSISMFTNEKINVPVLGLVENMAWFTPRELPENKYYIFGKEGGVNLAKKAGISLLGQIPLVQAICESGDKGVPVVLEKGSPVSEAFMALSEKVIVEINRVRSSGMTTKRVEINKSK